MKPRLSEGRIPFQLGTGASAPTPTLSRARVGRIPAADRAAAIPRADRRAIIPEDDES